MEQTLHRCDSTPGSLLTAHHVQVVTRFTESSVAPTYQRSPGQQRLIQHKKEAYWFYRYLSIVYDYIVNPGHWTTDMREDALSVAQLNKKDLKVRLAAVLCVPHDSFFCRREGGAFWLLTTIVSHHKGSVITL